MPNLITNLLSNKKLTIMLTILFLAALSITGYLYHSHLQEQERQAKIEAQIKKEKLYLANVQKVTDQMITTGELAEGMIDAYSDVWHEAIYEEYVEIAGEVAFDFDEALYLQQNVFTTDGSESELKNGINKVQNQMKSLNNPPKKHKELYNLTVNLYTQFNKITDNALEPTGSYNSFTEQTNQDIDSFITVFHELKIKLPEDEKF
jgi:hypothetical protein